MPEMVLNIDTNEPSNGGGMRVPYNKRGECSVCGKPAYDGRATKCEEHRTNKPKRRVSEPVTFVTSEGAGGQASVTVDAPKPPEASPLSPKQQKVATLKAQLLTEVNPQLVRGFALVCRPVPEHNFYELSGTQMVVKDPLGRTPMFAEWEADVIAHCFVELEEQPTVQMAGKFVGPLMPYLYMAGGVAVIGLHAYNCLTTRDKVLRQWAQMEAANRANPAMPPNAQPMPPPEAQQAPPPSPSEAPGVPLDEEVIDAEIVNMIPPGKNGNGSVEPGEFADMATA